MPGAATLIATMRGHGAYCALVSGGFDYYTRWIRDRLGFDYDQANSLGVAEGKLTGDVMPPILGRDAKKAALETLSAQIGIGTTEAITVGDGANDLEMLAAAGMGVAFRAKPVVAEAARARIDHGDLTALLYIQGYTAAEFVEPGRMIPKTAFAAGVGLAIVAAWPSHARAKLISEDKSGREDARVVEEKRKRYDGTRKRHHCIVGSARNLRSRQTYTRTC